MAAATDLELARGAKMKPLPDIATQLGMGESTCSNPIGGDMRTMPGLGLHPAAERIDIDEHGEIVGLS